MLIVYLLFKLFKLMSIFTTLIGYTKCDVTLLNTEESVSHMGYPFEKYKLQTEDKYTLGLERIPYSKHGNRTVGKPILLIHGLFISSYVFVFSNQSLSFSLSDAGYDVWLFNSRGTGLSRTYSIYSKLGTAPRMNRISWNYSFDEMGAYDFTAVVDFVLNKTGQPKVSIVGYSLGATIALVGLIEIPTYNDKVDKLVLMAPTSRMTSYGFPVTAFKHGFPLFEYAMKKQNFFPVAQDPDAVHRFFRWICSYTIFYPNCVMFIALSEGTLVNYKEDAVVNTITDFLQPVSKKLMFHWNQLMSSKKFCKYDYGTNGNIQHYNFKTPPEYNLSKVIVPTFILHSKTDKLSTTKDVNWLENKLPNVKGVYYVDAIKFGHLSFVMHENIDYLVNGIIVKALSSN